ncbi:MAG: acetyl-CoA decarbonylase/synthase complex subunit gamma [Deltaproteobacteria bacterium]|nr:acetyl-CoA decarbonylase/synthase complex subunit gamma [Deltaproteobacteria bacterium]MBL7104970.1 acetyl-CoA decarbonylase/synthase complex subunit gamma [Bacteroidales bacterium]
MALTGLQIQKLLPKTNCKECGSNTCLAFAMKLASKKIELSVCPYASEKAIKILGAASEPPVKGIVLGKDKQLKTGEETVLYRHEKTFVNQTIIAININDTDNQEEIDKTITNINEYTLERVGEVLTVEMIALTQKGNDAKQYADLAVKIWKSLNRPLILNSPDIESVSLAAVAIKGSGSVIASATKETVYELKNIAADNGHALAITAPDLDELVSITTQVKKDGFNNLILQFQTLSLAEQFQTNSIARRMALKANFKPLGYPSLKFIKMTDLLESTILAITEMSKYGGICVLPTFDPAQLVSLMTLRLNIYTDPQKPIQVDPKPYPVGEPVKDSPVFLTTNFSLTYFIVSGEIENSGISAWLVVPQCEGMSVLTAWAAGKFSGATIAKAIKEMGLEDMVTTREIIIPGYVSQISGDLEENLPGWTVIVGPQEAGDIESFVKVKFG